MQRYRVVNFCTNFRFLQEQPQGIPHIGGNPDNKLIIDMAAFLFNRQDDKVFQSCLREQAAIDSRMFLSGACPSVKMFQLNGYNGCLKCIQPEVSTNQMVMIFMVSTVISELVSIFR